MNSLKNKKFWASLIALIVLLARLFGVKIDAPYINEVIDSLCAVLILFGISSKTAPTEEDETTVEDKNSDISDDNDNTKV